MLVESSVGLAVGCAVGWFSHGAHQRSSARVLAESYERKLELAESDRDEARRAVQVQRGDVERLQQHVATLDTDAERLLHELEVTLGAQLASEAELERRAHEITVMRGEVERARQFADEVLHESADASREHDELVTALADAQRTLVEREADIAALTARTAELEALAAHLRVT